jgi:hypothetical protein
MFACVAHIQNNQASAYDNHRNHDRKRNAHNERMRQCACLSQFIVS